MLVGKEPNKGDGLPTLYMVNGASGEDKQLKANQITMIYKVRAKYKKESTSEFFEKLTDGSISSQKPDGKEIVSSMKRAKIIEPGIVEWFEMCFCSSPLQHERETVYDLYLSDIIAEIVDDYGEVEGESFWSYLNSVHKSNWE